MKKNKHPKDSTSNGFWINLIDTPGYSDFSSDVTVALRVSDGALVVIDCMEGFCLQTEIGLRQALSERIKPVVMINKIELAILELEPENAYQAFLQITESINVLISTYEDEKLGDINVLPSRDNLAFGSGIQGWGFTLSTFADMYAAKFGVPKEKLIEKLWGNNYFDAHAKKWKKSAKGADKPLKRAFCQYILDPISLLVKSILNNEKAKYSKMLKSLNIILSPEEGDQSGQALLKTVMRKFLPIDQDLLDMLVLHLPSPVTAQKYRVECIYEGPANDEYAQAIAACDPNGPLMLYIAKLIPTNEKGRFYAFGRVFSGTVSPGQIVNIMGPEYNYGDRRNSFINSVVQGTALLMGRNIEPISDCPCGNIITLLDIDRNIMKSCTITTSEVAHKFKNMKCNISSIFRVVVEPKDEQDLPKLLEGLRILSLSESGVQCFFEEAGEHIVSGNGELHLETCLKEFEELCSIPLRISYPYTSYRETVSQLSDRTILSKSPNRSNRLYMKSEPLPNDLVDDIEARKCNFNSREYFKYLNVENYRVWCFGPRGIGTNVLIDQTEKVRDLVEIKEYCVNGFTWATTEGVLAGEIMRGIRFNILDATLHYDVFRRGYMQVFDACRRCIYGSQLSASPRLVEPFYLVEIQCTEQSIGDIFCLFNKRRGYIIEEIRPDVKYVPIYTFRAYLPVSESFGFIDEIRPYTVAQPQFVFDHWLKINDDPLEPSSKVAKIIAGIRKRKGLSEEIPPLQKFLDRL